MQKKLGREGEKRREIQGAKKGERKRERPLGFLVQESKLPGVMQLER